MNGYFQLINEEMQTSIMLFPAVNSGLALDVSEVEAYLSLCGIRYDKSVLRAQADALHMSPMKVPLLNEKSDAQAEQVKVRIAKDNMVATVRFYSPSNDGTVLTKEEILDSLKEQGVLYGIQEDVLDGFLLERSYCNDYKIALGDECVPGQDARIEYLFDPNRKARPTLKEDGSVDFYNLNFLNGCRKGDVLAKMIPAVPAKPGKTVKGNEIPGKESKQNVNFRYGKNVVLSDSGNELHSTTDGYIIMEGDKVCVSDVLELNNIDHSTGNIDHKGSIHITGNVCDNFTVKAAGNVIVDGVVEGAQILSEGDVIIARGMNGKGKGKIVAGGNVIAKFLESVDVNADGYVDCDSILHSKVKTKDEVHVVGKRGFITGGRICATKGVQVKNLGSRMGVNTIVEVGADPSLKQKIHELEQTLEANERIIKKAKPLLSSATDKLKKGISIPNDQLALIKKTHSTYNVAKSENARVRERLKKIKDALEKSKRAAVVVSGEAFVSTKVIIGGVSMEVERNVRNCKFIRDRGAVKIRGL